MKNLIFVAAALIFSVSTFAQQSHTLKTDTVIKVGGLHITCAAGSQLVTSKGRVTQCTPKHDFSFVNPKQYRYAVAGSKPVTFDQQGNVISFTLAKNAVVETANGQHYSARGGEEVEFYPNGAVKRFTPRFTISVEYARGRTRTWPAGKEVVFDQNGFIHQ